jgi:hypothetical protein
MQIDAFAEKVTKAGRIFFQSKQRCSIRHNRTAVRFFVDEDAAIWRILAGKKIAYQIRNV